MSSTTILKALTKAGIGPRRQLADAIHEGRVKVNGKMVGDFSYPLNLEMDRISIDGRLINLKPKQKMYLMLNKPKGVMSTTSDERGRPTVIDILPDNYRHLRLHPVGRLDKDSTGLLLLTNDGELTYRLTHPGFEHEKEYLVSINAGLQASEKRRLEQGLKLEDGTTQRATVKEVDAKPFNYSITIHEGRKRQVRRMFKHLGHHVLALKRVRMGGIRLGDLREGEARKLSAREVRMLLGDKADCAESSFP
jgi:23S rRNA pseudouridine2605 synthase